MDCSPSRIRPFLRSIIALVFLVYPTSVWCIELDGKMLPDVSMEEGAPIHIQADSITYDKKADRYVAEGKVEITRGEMILRADRVTLDNNTRVAAAEGNVEVVQREDRLQGERLEMNIDNRTGKITKGKLFFERYNLTVVGDEIERLDENRYRVQGATLTTCLGDRPDWRFRAKRIELTLEGYAKVRHATFDVRNVPILYFPYLAYPARTERKTGFLLPEYQSSSRVGHGVSVPFFWAFHQSGDATFTQTYFTKRGYQQGVELRYAPRDWLEGSLKGEYLRDQQDVDPDEDWRGGSPRKNRDRWRVTGEQEAKLPMGVVSKAYIDIVSDNYYLEDFSTNFDERYLRYLTSTLNATKNWKSYLVAGEAEYYRDLNAPDNDNGRTPQKLPSLLFHRTLIPAFGLPLSFGWNTTFDNLWREKGGRGQIIGLAPVVSLPLKAGPYISFVPFARWEESLFFTQDDPQADKVGHRSAYQYGASISTELAKVFSGFGEKIQKIKHTVRPEVRLDITGRASSDDWPRDFLAPIPSDRLVSLVLNQFLTGKVLGEDDKPRHREFVRMDIVQSFSLKEAWRDLEGPDDKREPVLPIRGELEIRFLGEKEGRTKSIITKGPWAEPRLFLFTNLEGRYDWYESNWEEFSATVRGGDHRGDELALSYKLVQRETEENNLKERIRGSLRVRAARWLDIMGQGSYDPVKNEWVQYGYGFDLHPTCWAISFRHSIDLGFEGRDTDHSFKLKVNLLGLGRLPGF